MGDTNHLILTATGADRVGLVEAISQFISRNDCNIEDSKMAVFCGEFAIIVLLSGDDSDLSKISGGYQEIEASTGLTITIKNACDQDSRGISTAIQTHGFVYGPSRSRPSHQRHP